MDARGRSGEPSVYAGDRGHDLSYCPGTSRPLICYSRDIWRSGSAKGGGVIMAKTVIVVHAAVHACVPPPLGARYIAFS